LRQCSLIWHFGLGHGGRRTCRGCRCRVFDDGSRLSQTAWGCGEDETQKTPSLVASSPHFKAGYIVLTIVTCKLISNGAFDCLKHWNWKYMSLPHCIIHMNTVRKPITNWSAGPSKVCNLQMSFTSEPPSVPRPHGLVPTYWHDKEDKEDNNLNTLPVGLPPGS